MVLILPRHESNFSDIVSFLDHSKIVDFANNLQVVQKYQNYTNIYIQISQCRNQEGRCHKKSQQPIRPSDDKNLISPSHLSLFHIYSHMIPCIFANLMCQNISAVVIVPKQIQVSEKTLITIVHFESYFLVPSILPSLLGIKKCLVAQTSSKQCNINKK